MGKKSNQDLISVEMLKDRIDDRGTIIVDARTASDYAKGHIKNSVNIQLTEIIRTQKGLPAMCQSGTVIEYILGSRGIDNDTPVIIYDNFGGVLASRLLWTLEHFGHEKVGMFDGSIKRWGDEEGDFTTDVPVIKKAVFTAQRDESTLATAEWIHDRLTDNTMTCLDVRTPGEYTGKTAYGMRGGHIPGAVNVHWLEAIDPSNGRFRSPDELRDLYENRGIQAGKEIVTFCWMGLRASHGYAMLRLLGYPHVRVYDASWAEWGEIDSLPVER